MILKNVDAKTYKDFALKSPYISIYQVPEWGELKEQTGWVRHLLALYDQDKIVGVTMLLEKKLPLKLSLFYAPRGYLIDVDNFSLLKEFHTHIVNYIKKHHGFLLKVDPNVCYAIRNSDGVLETKPGENAFYNFKKLGFRHLGFTENFETLQPRFLCRIKLQNTYDETLNSFAKSTKKNIMKTIDMGVRVKKIGPDDIEMFTKLLNDTAEEKNFIVRPASYYKRQVELMPEYTTLYLAYIDTNLYYNYVWHSLENAQKDLNVLTSQMKKINVGAKIKRKEEELKKKVVKLNKELNDAKSLQKRSKEINIGALMSIFIGDEGITFMSGTNHLYKEFNPKYAFYNEHIKDSLSKHLKYVNFYGISGDMNHNGKYYGIYEMKKGFNPEIIELLGEFDYVLNPFVYYSYKMALQGYKLLKKIKQ